MESYLLKARDISVEFPGVRALDHVDFQLAAGEIHALAGANGAGKSTLMKVLAGTNPGYTGEVWLDGRTVELRSPAAAKKLGIHLVCQEVDQALAPALSAAENMLLDDLSQPGSTWIRWREVYRQAEELKDRLHLDFDVRTPAGRLTLAQKQMVLIARALHSQCRILLLDEPTAPLSAVETETLFSLCRALVRERETIRAWASGGPAAAPCLPVCRRPGERPRSVPAGRRRPWPSARHPGASSLCWAVLHLHLCSCVTPATAAACTLWAATIQRRPVPAFRSRNTAFWRGCSLRS